MPTQAVQASRIGACAARVSELIAGFVASARGFAAALPSLAELADSVALTLRPLLATRLAVAGVNDVRMLPSMGRAARMEMAAEGRLAGGASPDRIARVVDQGQRLGDARLDSISSFEANAVKLSPAQTLGGPIQRKAAIFAKRLPAGHLDCETYVTSTGEVIFSSKVPGRVRGSFAIYRKIVDSQGATLYFYKASYEPSGALIHVKVKFP